MSRKGKSRRAQHRSIEELAMKHVYATLGDPQFVNRMLRVYGRKATNVAIASAKEVQKMCDPDFVPKSVSSSNRQVRRNNAGGRSPTARRRTPPDWPGT